MPQIFVPEPFSDSLFSAIENFILKRVMSRYSVELLFVSQHRLKIVGTFWCTGKIRVSKKLFAKEVSRFSVENFCLTVQKKFAGEHFYVWQSFCYPKILLIKGGGREGVSQFSVKNFMSQCRPISYGNRLVCH